MSTPGKRATAKRAAQTAPGPNVQTRLAKINSDFDGVRNLSSVWEQNDTQSRVSLYAALEATFVFGEELREEPDLLEEFLKARDIKWTKPIRENPYIGIVKLAFPKIEKGSASQYSRVLRFARDKKPIGMQLGDWLGGPGGIADRYKEATRHYDRPKADEKDRVHQQKIADAKTALDGMSLAPPFHLHSPSELDGYATALVRLKKDETQAELVVLLDHEELKIEPFLLRYLPPSAPVPIAQPGKQLWRLHRAIGLAASITPARVGSHSRYFLIENALDDGKLVSRVSAVSEAYSFPSARVSMNGFVDGLDAVGYWLLTDADATNFVSTFDDAADWTVQADEEEEGSYILGSSAGQFALKSWVPGTSSEKLKVAMKPQFGDKSFALSLDKCNAFLDWNKLLGKSKVKRKAASPISKRLAMEISGRIVSVSVSDLNGPSIDVLALEDTGTLNSGRWLAITDFVAVCNTLVRSDVPATGRFVCMEQHFPDGGIEMQIDLGDDRMDVWLPFVINPKMDYAAMCEELA